MAYYLEFEKQYTPNDSDLVILKIPKDVPFLFIFADGTGQIEITAKDTIGVVDSVWHNAENTDEKFYKFLFFRSNIGYTGYFLTQETFSILVNEGHGIVKSASFFSVLASSSVSCEVTDPFSTSNPIMNFDVALGDIIRYDIVIEAGDFSDKIFFGFITKLTDFGEIGILSPYGNFSPPLFNMDTFMPLGEEINKNVVINAIENKNPDTGEESPSLVYYSYIFNSSDTLDNIIPQLQFETMTYDKFKAIYGNNETNFYKIGTLIHNGESCFLCADKNQNNCLALIIGGTWLLEKSGNETETIKEQMVIPTNITANITDNVERSQYQNPSNSSTQTYNFESSDDENNKQVYKTIENTSSKSLIAETAYDTTQTMYTNTLKEIVYDEKNSFGGKYSQFLDSTVVSSKEIINNHIDENYKVADINTRPDEYVYTAEPNLNEDDGKFGTDDNSYKDILSSDSRYNLSEIPSDVINTEQLEKINRFHLMSQDASAPSRRSFIFMTRPDLNFFNTDDTENNSGGGGVGTIRSEVQNVPYLNYVANITNSPLKYVLSSLQYYDKIETDNQHVMETPWLSIISNQCLSYSIDDRDLTSNETGETFHGHKIKYGQSSFKHEIAGSMTLEFRESRDMILYHTIRSWVEYIHNISYGILTPKHAHILNNVLDYAVSLYYITTDETMENILYWEKLVGVYPTNVPDSFFRWDSGNSYNNNYSVSFDFSLRNIMDPADLCEINCLYDTVYSKTYAGGRASEPPCLLHSKSLSNDALLKEENNRHRSVYANEYFQYLGKYYKGSTDALSDEDIAHFYHSEIDIDKTKKSSLFLPNYLPEIRSQGIPYVQGPYISMLTNGKYRLNWI